jgi:hypothetical protein
VAGPLSRPILSLASADVVVPCQPASVILDAQPEIDKADLFLINARMRELNVLETSDSHFVEALGEHGFNHLGGLAIGF